MTVRAVVRGKANVACPGISKSAHHAEGWRRGFPSALRVRPTPKNEGAFMSADEILTFLEEAARKSRTGISFDWVPSVDGEPSGFRFMRRHHVGEPCKSIKQAILLEIGRARS